MARVKCRCGETLEVPADATERLKCPRCGAKIRVRRSPDAPGPAGSAGESAGDGYIRFPCPCGRRLKVRAQDRPEAGKCPDCGRVVPVPESAWAASDGSRSGGSTRGAAPARAPSNGSRTADMDAHDLEQLEQWARRCQEPAAPIPEAAATPVPSRSPSPSPAVKVEAGLRVCPRCGKPLHMSATVCRSCGEPVPKR